MKLSWSRVTSLFQAWRDWINPIPLIALALILLFGGLMIFGDEGLLTLRRLTQTRHQLLKKEQELTHRLDRLHTETDRLQDPEYLESLVRKEFGYVKPGETVYQFPDPTGTAPQPTEEASDEQHPEHHGK